MAVPYIAYMNNVKRALGLACTLCIFGLWRLQFCDYGTMSLYGLAYHTDNYKRLYA